MKYITEQGKKGQRTMTRESGRISGSKNVKRQKGTSFLLCRAPESASPPPNLIPLPPPPLFIPARSRQIVFLHRFYVFFCWFINSLVLNYIFIIIFFK